MTNKKDNRVLGRRGARIVNEKETKLVNGGLQTETFCSFDPTAGADGDQFTGDCLSK
ncbi:MAG TPA: hypothetical protein VKY85_15785 [Candidatus Angelobacter sp.]|jgi:hypothetical protein|nr:hypothetical protein [Candidatus Angelobacter sp.]